MYDRDGDMPLLDVGHGSNTPLHLAEHHADFEKTRTRERAPLLRDNKRVVVEYDDTEIETDDFEAVGGAFERQHGATEGLIATATTALLDQPALVDFTEDWLKSNH